MVAERKPLKLTSTSLKKKNTSLVVNGMIYLATNILQFVQQIIRI